MSSVIALLEREFSEKVAARSLTAATHMRADLGFDSLDLLALIAEIENAGGRSLEDADRDVFTSIGSLARYLAGRSSACWAGTGGGPEGSNDG